MTVRAFTVYDMIVRGADVHCAAPAIITDDREIRLPVGTSIENAQRTLVLKTFSFVDGDHQRAATMLGIEEEELRDRLSRAVASEQPAGVA